MPQRPARSSSLRASWAGTRRSSLLPGPCLTAVGRRRRTASTVPARTQRPGASPQFARPALGGIPADARRTVRRGARSRAPGPRPARILSSSPMPRCPAALGAPGHRPEDGGVRDLIRGYTCVGFPGGVGDCALGDPATEATALVHGRAVHRAPCARVAHAAGQAGQPCRRPAEDSEPVAFPCRPVRQGGHGPGSCGAAVGVRAGTGPHLSRQRPQATQPGRRKRRRSRAAWPLLRQVPSRHCEPRPGPPGTPRWRRAAIRPPAARCRVPGAGR